MQRFVIRQPTEQAYVRHALFAIELLDAVTLARVTDGVSVVAEGLRGQPVQNTGGLFVWRGKDHATLRSIAIDPGVQPYQPRTLQRAELRLPPLPRPLTSVELSPRMDYVFPSGITALRGSVVEERGGALVPVLDAEVQLRWLDDDGVTWRDAATRSLTNAKGDFAAFLRLAASDVPQVDANGAVTVRLRVRRDPLNERSSTDLKLAQGRVTDPTSANTMTFNWDVLLP